MAKQNNIQTLKTTVMQKEFWVGLVTTLILLMVAVKLIPWNSIHMTPNTTAKVVSPVPSNGTHASIIPTGESIASTGAMTVAENATSSAAVKTSSKKVVTLADTTGNSYIVESGDNYYTISMKVCGSGKYFESIQADNNNAALYTGDQIVVNCTE